MTGGRIDGFRWSRNADGTYTLFDVPVFYECERDGEVYDEAWIRSAYDQLFEAEITKGHRPPVTFGHRRAANPEPAGAGWFAARRVGEFAGKSALFVNMTLNEAAFDAVKTKRVPYRSVEAIRPSAEKEADELLIESLSLLDNAPYLALPMTFLGEEVESEDAQPCAPVTVTFSRFRSRVSPVVAFASVGNRCHVFSEAPMSDDEMMDEAAPETTAEEVVAAEPEAESEAKTEEGVGKAVSLLRDLMATPVPLQDARIVASMLREKLSELESGMDDDGDDDVGRSPPSDDPAQPDLSQEKPKDGKEPMNMSAKPKDTEATKDAAEAFAKNRLLDQRLSKLEAEREQDAAIRATCKRLENVAFASDPEAECRAVIERFPGSWRESLKFAADMWERSAPKIRKASARYADDMASLPEEVTALNLSDPTEIEAAMKAHEAFASIPAPLRKSGFASFYGANKRRFLPLSKATA